MTASIKWMLIIFTLVVITVSIFFAFFCKNCLVPKSNNSQNEENLNPPSDLTTDYNPYLTAPIFKVTGEDNGSLPYSLELVWPESFKQFNDNWVPRINCSEGDYRYNNQRDNKEVKISKIEFFNYLNSEIPEGTMVTGNCSDVDCYELNKNCILYMYK